VPGRNESLITKSADLTAVCRHLGEAAVFGFDTEFVGEHTFHPELCLIQIGSPEHLFIIDPLALEELAPFWNVLHDPKHLTIVHAGREEIRLCHLASGTRPGRVFDVQIAAGLIGLPYPMSHAGLVDNLLGVRLSKAETLTDWRARPLTPRQIRYAFDDVRHLLQLHERLHAELAQRERLSWAEEEFARLAYVATDEQAARERWRKLPGLGELHGRHLAIARELFAWRQAKAEALGKPARVVCRDDLIVELARREPTKAAELQLIRGLSKRDFEGIIATIERARRLPPEEWPPKQQKEIETPQMALIVDFLQVVVRQLAEELEIAPSLFGTVAEFKELVRHELFGEPLGPTTLLGQGWRAQHLKPRLAEVLRGKKSLRLSPIPRKGPLELH
jgi:ribonuclease D